MFQCLQIKSLIDKLSKINKFDLFQYIFKYILPSTLMIAIAIYGSIDTFTYNFDKLTPIYGTLKVHSYNYIHGRSDVVTPVVDINVQSESITVSYISSQLDSSFEFFQQQTKINNQKVEVWYLPQNSKFYLIHFLDSNDLNKLSAAQYTKGQLNKSVIYHKYIIPISLLITWIFVIMVEYNLIRIVLYYGKYALTMNEIKNKSTSASHSIINFILIQMLFILPAMISLMSIMYLFSLVE